MYNINLQYNILFKLVIVHRLVPVCNYLTLICFYQSQKRIFNKWQNHLNFLSINFKKIVMTSKVKRQRTVAKDDDILALIQDARVIWGREKDVERSLQTEDREFREIFGVGAITAMAAWNLLKLHNIKPDGGLVAHLLWAMMFLKCYAKEVAMIKMAGVKYGKTFRRWVWPFVFALSELESQVVSNLRIYCYRLFLMCF